MSEPTVVSLFCGGGGSSMGYKTAGYRVVGAVDFSKVACDNYAANFPGTPLRCVSVTDIPDDGLLPMFELRELDVLDGSPPCQGFSVVGRRRVGDDRNALFHHYVRLLRGALPRAFVMENVPGMTFGRMRTFTDAAMAEFSASGYHCRCRILCAANYGVPQARRRVYFVGFRNKSDFDRYRWPESLGNVQTVGMALSTKVAANEDGWLCASQLFNDSYAKLWPFVPQGKAAGVVVGKGFTNSVRLRWDRPSLALPKTNTGRGFATVTHPWVPRALTVREYARLQGFPDGYEFVGTDLDAYGIVGNSVPPPMAAAVATSVKEALSDR